MAQAVLPHPRHLPHSSPIGITNMAITMPTLNSLKPTPIIHLVIPLHTPMDTPMAIMTNMPMELVHTGKDKVPKIVLLVQ